MARGSRRSGCMLVSLIKLAFVLAILFALAFLMIFGYMLWQEKNVPEPSAGVEAMIVLGAQVNSDGSPSVQLELRLNEALAQYSLKPMPIVVCGAQGADEPATEASIMRDWLAARGVQAEHILVDETSVNTRQNIANAIQLLPPGADEVLIVTSDYHLPRAMAIARDLGLRPSGAGSPIKQEYWLKNHARETLAWGKYFLVKYLPFLEGVLPGE
ncbi:MAG: YdcF family protein [Christensenellales bacterium]|jgi:SanA protein